MDHLWGDGPQRSLCNEALRGGARRPGWKRNQGYRDWWEPIPAGGAAREDGRLHDR
jgi:hypothetical protein